MTLYDKIGPEDVPSPYGGSPNGGYPIRKTYSLLNLEIINYL